MINYLNCWYHKTSTTSALKPLPMSLGTMLTRWRPNQIHCTLKSPNITKVTNCARMLPVNFATQLSNKPKSCQASLQQQKMETINQRSIILRIIASLVLGNKINRSQIGSCGRTGWDFWSSWGCSESKTERDTHWYGHERWNIPVRLICSLSCLFPPCRSPTWPDRPIETSRTPLYSYCYVM